MTILMVINMAMRIVCNKDEEDDSDGESKYSEEWTQYYVLSLYF